MPDIFIKLFDNGSFIPHGYCLAWNPLLLWTLVIANGVIGISYYSIPIALVYFVRRQRELKFSGLFLMFGAFIFACGTTHLLGILDIWRPQYRLDAVVMTITAAISLATAAMLWPLIPRASRYLEQNRVDRKQLLDVNQRLKESLTQLQVQRGELLESEKRLGLIINSAPIGKAVVALDGRFVRVNQSLAAMLGYSEAELLAKTFQDITHADDLAADLAHVKSLLDNQSDSYRMEKRYIHKNGALITIQLDVVILRDEHNQPQQFIAQIQDITQRKQVEVELTSSKVELEDSLLRLLEQNREITVLGRLGETLQACELIEEIAAPISNLAPQLFPGYSGCVYLMHTPHDYLDPIASWGEPIASEAVFAPQSCWAVRTGEIRWNDASDGLRCSHIVKTDDQPLAVCVPMNAHGEFVGLLYLQPGDTAPVELIGERRRALQRRLAIIADRIGIAIANIQLSARLREQATRDPLTGLFNRRYLQETLSREVTRRQREQGSLAVLMIDVDHFKRYNDIYGHEVGDQVLRVIGSTLLEHCRDSDIACRFGGEEFAMVLPATTLEQAVLKAGRLRDDIRLMPTPVATTEALTVSIGIAMCPGDGITAGNLLQAADQALYRAKRNGRDRVVRFRDTEASANQPGQGSQG